MDGLLLQAVPLPTAITLVSGRMQGLLRGFSVRAGKPSYFQGHRSLVQRYSSGWAPAVRLIEVGPRDGLQNIKQIVPTTTKIELIHRLAETGLRNIEATSFVSPRWVPALADGADVMKGIRGLAGKSDFSFPVLTPNLKAIENALAAGAQDVVVFASVTEAFSKANQNCTVEQALAQAEATTKVALSHGLRVRGVVSCIFSDPFLGPTAPETVLPVVQKLLDMGCYEVGLGDTLGVGTPKDTERLLNLLLRTIPADKLAGHFHDTYGQGVANVVKAYEMGIRKFDSSVAGLGGCPYAPGAKGNVSTEDVVYTLEKSGVRTGVDLDKLVSVGQWISKELNIEYGSRVGAALTAKCAPKPPAKLESSAEPRQPKASSRSWEIVQDTGEYRVARSGATLRVTLTRARNGNALTNSMLKGLTDLFHDLANDASVYHVVLESEGKYFCTGMDLSGNTDTASEESDYYSKVVNLYHAIDHAPQTTIVLVNGPCFGGGVGLTFVCDVRFVTPHAGWTLSEIKIGVSPAIISKYLVREWGPSMAREGMISGRDISPDELFRVGAIHHISDDEESLENKLDSYLNQLEKCAPRSAAVNKELTRLAWYDPESKAQAELIEQTFTGMMVSRSEGDHGIKQFQKKVKSFSWHEFWQGRNPYEGLKFKGSPRL